jgi:hypothetical protein
VVEVGLDLGEEETEVKAGELFERLEETPTETFYL